MKTVEFDLSYGDALSVLFSIAPIGLRRASIQNFDDAFDPETALAIVRSTPSEIFKKLIEIQVNRALILEQQNEGDFDTAIRASQKLIDGLGQVCLPEIEVVCRAQLGNLYRRANKIQKAYKEFTEAYKRFSNVTRIANSLIEYELGYIYYLKGQYANSVKWLNESITSAEDDEDVLGQVAGLGVLSKQYYLNGLTQEASESIDRALELVNSNSKNFEADWMQRWHINILAHKASIELVNQAADKAGEFLEKASANIPMNANKALYSTTLQLLYGQCYIAKQEYDRAIDCLMDACRQVHDSEGFSNKEAGSEILATLAEAYFLMGDQDAAFRKFNEALKLPPHNANHRGIAIAHMGLSALELANGKPSQAINHLHLALPFVKSHFKPLREMIETQIAEIGS